MLSLPGTRHADITTSKLRISAETVRHSQPATQAAPTVSAIIQLTLMT